jgi:hypothetical protein
MLMVGLSKSPFYFQRPLHHRARPMRPLLLLYLRVTKEILLARIYRRTGYVGGEPEMRGTGDFDVLRHSCSGYCKYRSESIHDRSTLDSIHSFTLPQINTPNLMSVASLRWEPHLLVVRTEPGHVS